MRPRNVLHLIDTGGPGGAETIFLNLVERLDSTRWGSVAVVPERDWLWESLEARGLNPTLVPTEGSFDLRYLRRLWAIVRRHEVELIHAHLLTASVYGSAIGALLGISVVCTFHGQVDLSSGDVYRSTKLRIINRRKNRVVFVSESLRRTFLETSGLDADRTAVVYNGIDTDEFSPGDDRTFREEMGIRADEILIGAVGNVRFAKDYPNLLRAAALLRERGLPVRFVVVGDTRSPLFDEVIALRNQLHLEDSVVFAGFQEDVPRVMRSLDLYMISSSAEGFSLSTVQAMASGVPVVATRCGGPEEIVQDGVNGRLVPRGRPDAMAVALETLITDPGRARMLALAGRERARLRFSLDAMVDGYDRLYGDCLGLDRPGGDAQ